MSPNSGAEADIRHLCQREVPMSRGYGKRDTDPRPARIKILTARSYTLVAEPSEAMLGHKQHRNIRVVACVMTGGAAFFVTLQLSTLGLDPPPSNVTVIQAVPRAEVKGEEAKREDECLRLQRDARLGQIPDDLKRAIIKYALCDGTAIAPTQSVISLMR